MHKLSLTSMGGALYGKEKRQVASLGEPLIIRWYLRATVAGGHPRDRHPSIACPQTAVIPSGYLQEIILAVTRHLLESGAGDSN